MATTNLDDNNNDTHHHHYHDRPTRATWRTLGRHGYYYYDY